MIEQVRIEGLDELRDVLLRHLPPNLQGKALQATLAKAAQPILRTARSLAPVKSGRLKRAIYSVRGKDSTPGNEVRLVLVRQGKRFKKTDRDAYYWKFVEFGHMTRRGKNMAGPPRLIPARPFMRPAFNQNKYRALEIIKAEMKGQIEKVARRAQQRSAHRLVRAARRSLTGF